MRSLTGLRAGWNRRTNLFTATRSFISPARHAITGHAERLPFHSAWTARCRGSGGSDRPSDQNRGASPGFSGCSGDEDWFALPTSALSSLPTAKPSYRLPRKKTSAGDGMGRTRRGYRRHRQPTATVLRTARKPVAAADRPRSRHDRVADTFGDCPQSHSHIILTSETQQRHQGITPARRREPLLYLDSVVESQNPLWSPFMLTVPFWVLSLASFVPPVVFIGLGIKRKRESQRHGFVIEPPSKNSENSD